MSSSISRKPMAPTTMDRVTAHGHIPAAAPPTAPTAPPAGCRIRGLSQNGYGWVMLTLFFCLFFVSEGEEGNATYM